MNIFSPALKKKATQENMVEIRKISSHVTKVNTEVIHSLLTQKLEGASYNYQLTNF